MRQAFAHEAVVAMAPGEDIRAPGAAITVALCGDWEHRSPCPLAPHHTDVRRSGARLRLRVLFASEPASEANIRTRIEQALSASSLTGPDGKTTHWRLLNAQPCTVRTSEAEHAEQLIKG
ncbi:hypothetical protein [Actinomadura sp. 9N407]|uniref:hypothetical protein n=1 Tax=Actinomadura sp. 9N407 TaxID=3375154 RepID=UPI0037A582D6